MCEVEKIFKELAEYKRIQEETSAIIDSLTDEIKKYMTDESLTILTSSDHKACYRDVSSTRIDTTRIKKERPEIAKEYSKTIVSKRFTFE